MAVSGVPMAPSASSARACSCTVYQRIMWPMASLTPCCRQAASMALASPRLPAMGFSQRMARGGWRVAARMVWGACQRCGVVAVAVQIREPTADAVKGRRIDIADGGELHAFKLRVGLDVLAAGPVEADDGGAQ